jgi:hypothetical protein
MPVPLTPFKEARPLMGNIWNEEQYTRRLVELSCARSNFELSKTMRQEGVSEVSKVELLPFIATGLRRAMHPF